MNTEFKFGLESEYIVFDRKTQKAKWHSDLKFGDLYEIFETISLEGIPSLKGLELEPPHKTVMPYVVEGYHLPDMDFQSKELLPKGVEIRTPVCSSITEMMETQKTLLSRLLKAMHAKDLGLLALSHHPDATTFRGPQNKRRHDYWMWAMEVMTTYGPDINIGVSDERMKTLSSEDFAEKLNYYSPGITALTVGSPFRDGKLWKIREETGRSVRTYRRSILAPPIEIHPDENNRLEFKTSDMSPDLQDYEAMTLMFLALILDDSLKGRASNATRIYDLGRVAIEGLHDRVSYDRAKELLASADSVLPSAGFSVNALGEFERRIRFKTTPADFWIQRYHELNGDMAAVLGEIEARTARDAIA